MKRPHLLRVTADPGAFRSLVELAASAGHRVGWLELDAVVDLPSPLADAFTAGAFRSVAATASGSVAVKQRSGPWVLEDLLREHFLGCRLVLIRGGAPLDPDPERLESVADGRWRVGSEGATRELGSEQLLRWLRRPPKRST